MNLVVVNFNNNAFCSDVKFDQTIKHILPRIAILNPEKIMKVSCFENFKEMAFFIGNLSNGIELELESERGVPERTVNI
jgi:hypothetical protein